MGYKLLTQIALVVTAVLIVFTYVRPTFQHMKQVQDETMQYANAVQKATQYNQQLASLIQKENNFSAANLQTLQTYLPNSVDPMSVVSDIDTIAQMSGLSVTNAAVSKVQIGDKKNQRTAQTASNNNTASSTTVQLKPLDFNVVLHGTYASYKQFLNLIGKNKYPLQIINASVGKFGQATAAAASTPVGAETTDYTMLIRTYSLSH